MALTAESCDWADLGCEGGVGLLLLVESQKDRFWSPHSVRHVYITGIQGRVVEISGGNCADPYITVDPEHIHSVGFGFIRMGNAAGVSFMNRRTLCQLTAAILTI